MVFGTMVLWLHYSGKKIFFRIQDDIFTMNVYMRYYWFAVDVTTTYTKLEAHRTSKQDNIINSNRNKKQGRIVYVVIYYDSEIWKRATLARLIIDNKRVRKIPFCRVVCLNNINHMIIANFFLFFFTSMSKIHFRVFHYLPFQNSFDVSITKLSRKIMETAIQYG